MAKKKRVPASFPFYPDDWLSSTDVDTMTLEQQGAYLRLLCHQWKDPTCTLPDNDLSLAMLSGLADEWTDKGSRIRLMFVSHPRFDHRIHNLKLTSKRKDVEKWRKSLSENGKRGAKTRWQDDSPAIGPANGPAIASYSSPLPSSSSEEDLNKNTAQPTWKSGSAEALIAAEYVRMNPAVLGIEKATKLMEFFLARGVKAAEAQEAVNNPKNKGQFLWDIMNRLSPQETAPRGKGRPDVHDEVKRILAGRGA